MKNVYGKFGKDSEILIILQAGKIFFKISVTEQLNNSITISTSRNDGLDIVQSVLGLGYTVLSDLSPHIVSVVLKELKEAKDGIESILSNDPSDYLKSSSDIM